MRAKFSFAMSLIPFCDARESILQPHGTNSGIPPNHFPKPLKGLCDVAEPKKRLYEGPMIISFVRWGPRLPSRRNTPSPDYKIPRSFLIFPRQPTASTIVVLPTCLHPSFISLSPPRSLVVLAIFLMISTGSQQTRSSGHPSTSSERVSAR
jgi:hypothetical protein